MKILVTGATGFLGRALVSMLRKTHEVYTLSTSSQRNCKHFRIDLRRPFRLPIKFDVIIHLAAGTRYLVNGRKTKYQGELLSQKLSRIKKFRLLIIRFSMIYDFKESKMETKLFVTFYPFLKFIKLLFQKSLM
ncbi:MAG: NAD(P)-dependent oxidoreductase [Candidatus Aenigmarchaeota archaeon]|nr:NAD(P)-dependent oxidoreductase [Candidatus Aenigmarchaeota archaeon]